MGSYFRYINSTTAGNDYGSYIYDTKSYSPPDDNSVIYNWIFNYPYNPFANINIVDKDFKAKEMMKNIDIL